MKKKILPLTISILSLITAINCFSQSRKFFAVTGDQYGSVNWIAFRQGDLDEITPVKTLYVPAENNEIAYDATSGRQIVSNSSDAVAATPAPQTCGCAAINNRMVAAIAYDAKNNRLYYTPMMSNQLRYLDLNSVEPKTYVVTTQLLKNFSNQPGEASIITRMCFASDNFGYALTNDNEHLIRFTTDKQTAITDLGKLIDAPSNAENSVRTQIKSWGGDLIADANGNLYLFAMQRSVYKINPNTRLATFLGQIKNIPDDYTVNAAMVDNSSYVIVGSSTKTSTYYRVDLTTLEANALSKKTDQVYNVSDFANANLAFSKPVNTAAVAAVITNKVGVYPNPVNDKMLNIQFTNFSKGKYVIQLGEMEGKAVIQKEVKVSGSQTEKIFVGALSAGTYLVRVINDKGTDMYNDKVIISR
jgi:hypothetical protein